VQHEAMHKIAGAAAAKMSKHLWTTGDILNNRLTVVLVVMVDTQPVCAIMHNVVP
jgi:hypothetical protein